MQFTQRHVYIAKRSCHHQSHWLRFAALASAKIDWEMWLWLVSRVLVVQESTSLEGSPDGPTIWNLQTVSVGSPRLSVLKSNQMNLRLVTCVWRGCSAHHIMICRGIPAQDAFYQGNNPIRKQWHLKLFDCTIHRHSLPFFHGIFLILCFCFPLRTYVTLFFVWWLSPFSLHISLSSPPQEVRGNMERIQRYIENIKLK